MPARETLGPSEERLREGCCAGRTSGLNIPENKVGGKGAKALAEAIGSGVTKLGGLVFSSAPQSHRPPEKTKLTSDSHSPTF